jgi:hypothetical protein
MKAQKYLDIRLPHLRIPLWWPNLPADWRAWLPSRGNVLFTLLVVGALLWAASAGALPLRAPAAASTSTGTIAYQGRLADANGSPLTGTYNMIFRLYDAATGGTPLWTEQWTGSNGVKVSDGLFNVMLGSLTPIPTSLVTDHASLFLGITVGTDDEMTPRVQLGSVPFAVQALTVPDGSVTTAKIADGAVTQAKLGADVSLVPPDGSITTAKVADGAVTTAKIADGAITQAKAPFAVQHFLRITPEQYSKVSTGTYVVLLTGGGLVETTDIDISSVGFTATPVGIAQAVNSGGPDLRFTFARYTWDESTPTRARIVFFRSDGMTISPGYIRFNLILWSN